MDPSTIPDKVAVPKVIPMRLTVKQKLSLAKIRADEKRRKDSMVSKVKWDQARGI